jgi:hypothetical protein
MVKEFKEWSKLIAMCVVGPYSLLVLLLHGSSVKLLPYE